MKQQILMDMITKLETDRLILRMPMYGDGKSVNEAIRASIKELKLWMPFAQTPPTEEESEVSNRHAHIRFLKRETFRFLLFLKNTQEFVGTAELFNINWNIPKGELGYWIDTRYSGNGYMTEAIDALTQLAIGKLDFARVEIRCESENYGSCAIPEKCGYELEGILKNEDLSADGSRLTDTCVYAKIKQI